MSRNEGDIPPNYGGLVTHPNHNDVLSGRGGRINAHPGNVQFRELVKQYRGVYLSNETKKLEKAKIAAQIVEIVRNMDPPGRFLREGPVAWQEIGDERARKKAGQAMREKAEETRKELEQAKHYANSPPRVMPGYMPTLPQSYVPINSPGNPHSYMSPTMQHHHQYMPQSYMGHQQQMNNIPMNAYPHSVNVSSPTSLASNGQSHSSNHSKSPRPPGLNYGNAVAFDREFNRLSSSDSANTNVNSLRMSSLEGSFNSSNVSSEIGRSSVSSQNSSARREQMQILQTISDEHERATGGESIGSTWNDSWDQGPTIGSQHSVDSSVKSMESRRRKMFYKMKNETTNNLPSVLPGGDENTDRLHANGLMRESIISVDMQSTEMRKSTVIDQNQGRTTFSDYKMDSVNQMICEALDSDMDIFGSSTSIRSDTFNLKKDGQVTDSEASSFPNIPRPERQKRESSGFSAISDVSVRSSGIQPEPWAGYENTQATMPNLHLEMSDANRNRLFSDNSASMR